MSLSVKTKPSRQNHHRRPHIHKFKDPLDVFVVEANASMGHGPSNGPTMGRAVQADVGAAANLHHLFAIPTTGIGAVLIESNPARSQGISATGGNQSIGAWMPSDGIHRIE